MHLVWFLVKVNYTLLIDNLVNGYNNVLKMLKHWSLYQLTTRVVEVKVVTIIQMHTFIVHECRETLPTQLNSLGLTSQCCCFCFCPC